MKRVELTSEQDSILLEMYAVSRKTLEECYRTLGVGQKPVYRALARLGIKRLRGGKRPGSFPAKDGKKCCLTCLLEKTVAEFYSAKNSSDGYSTECKPCRTETNRRLKFKRVYGVTLTEYAVLFRKQKGLCAICHRPETRLGPDRNPTNLAIDHCHASGKIRRLLCNRCNIVLGLVRDDPKLCRQLARYLTQHAQKT